jgi:hypothetical protein
VQYREVVEVEVGIEREFPVRANHAALAEDVPRRQAELVEHATEIAEKAVDVKLRCWVKHRPHKTSAFAHREGAQTEGRGVDRAEFLAARNSDQFAGVVVHPAVVGAFEAGRRATTIHKDGAAM